MSAASFDPFSGQPDAAHDMFEHVFHGLPAVEARIQACNSLEPPANHVRCSRKTGAVLRDL
jgi:hypothetical protein